MVHQVITPRAARGQRLRMSYEEYETWMDENFQSEWVDGEVIVFMPPSTRHQRIAFFLAQLLSVFVRGRNLGEIFIPPFEVRLLDGYSYREPDIVFVGAHERDRVDAKRVQGPVDLLVELVSEDSVTRDRRDKLAEYQAAGVREYWIADVREGKDEFQPHRLTSSGTYELIPLDTDGRFRSQVVPGFWFRPDWLWQDPLPEPSMLLYTTIAPDLLDLIAQQRAARQDRNGRE